MRAFPLGGYGVIDAVCVWGLVFHRLVGIGAIWIILYMYIFYLLMHRTLVWKLEMKNIYICFLSRHFYGFSPGHEEIVVEFINTPDP